MIVTVSPDEGRGAGHALVRISGAGTTADTGFRISRPPGWPEPNLGPSGWQGTEASLAADEARRDGPDLVLAVGPAVCAWLEEDTYLFTLPAAGLTAPVAWPAIEEVHGGTVQFFQRVPPATNPGAGSENGTPSPAPAPQTPPVAAPPAAGPAGAAASDALPTPAGGKPSAMWALIAVVLLAGAGGVWWWRSHPAQSPPPPVVQAETPAPPTPPPAAPVPPATVPGPTSAPDPDTMSVADLVARNDPAQMLAQAQKRLATRPQDSMLLLESAGEDRHHGPALTMLARLYDPGRPRQGGIPPNARQAAKYYRDADRNGDHAGAEDRAALRRSLQSQRDAGDLNAKLTEQDFWP